MWLLSMFSFIILVSVFIAIASLVRAKNKQEKEILEIRIEIEKMEQFLKRYRLCTKGI